MFKRLNHPVVFLLLKFSLLYLAWFLFYDVWLRSPSEIISQSEIQSENTSPLDNWIITKTTSTSVALLSGLGFDIFYDGYRTLGVSGSAGLWVGDSCNAITLIALFTGLIICLSGIWWHKLIFIVCGSMAIWLLNVFRLVALAILDSYSRTLTEFNHTYTFTIIVYAFIIFLWYWWIKKFADLKENRNEPKV